MSDNERRTRFHQGGHRRGRCAWCRRWQLASVGWSVDSSARRHGTTRPSQVAGGRNTWIGRLCQYLPTLAEPATCLAPDSTAPSTIWLAFQSELCHYVINPRFTRRLLCGLQTALTRLLRPPRGGHRNRLNRRHRWFPFQILFRTLFNSNDPADSVRRCHYLMIPISTS